MSSTLPYASNILRLLVKITCFFLFMPHCVKAEGFVYDYGPEEFKREIKKYEGTFIMFYAPWCRHCTEFQPLWIQLAELINTKDSKFAVAQVDCTLHAKLCHEADITGYPTLLFFQKNSLEPMEYRGTRDMPALSVFLNDVFAMSSDNEELTKENKIPSDVKVHSGVAYLNDHNIEKFVSIGQHFIMFYTPWCKASQRLAPIWAALGELYADNEYVNIGKVNCMENEMTCKNFDIKQYPYLIWIVNGRIMGETESNTTEDLKEYIDKMVLAENHDPDKFMKKTKVLPVARISEETFETFLEKELVFVNFFAPWCAHCMQLNPLWIKLGEEFQNESRVLIADIDCVRSKTVCEMEKINGLPTLILYKNKKVVSVDHGGRPLESLITLVNEHLNGSTSKPVTEENLSDEDHKPITKDEL